MAKEKGCLSEHLEAGRIEGTMAKSNKIETFLHENFLARAMGEVPASADGGTAVDSEGRSFPSSGKLLHTPHGKD